MEYLEDRTVPSNIPLLAGIAHTNYVFKTSAGAFGPLSSPASPPYSPSQILSAYGFNLISENGAGQTIAIIDAYDDPTIKSDLLTFDQNYGLRAANLTVVNQTGGSLLPSPDLSGNWGVETALDVEWAHALAPGANILLVEANSADTTDLFAAASWAASQHASLDVSVISMSFGAGEYATETIDDNTFKTAATTGGVTFVAGTGDSGYPASYPAFSPYVVAAGGTSLQLDTNGAYLSETGWSGSGGSISTYESQPSYQKGVVTQSSTRRTVPDVAFDADSNTGVWIYDSFNNPYGGPWIGIGGTSFASPAWAAIVAITNQVRAQSGQSGQTSSLNGFTQTLPGLYKLPASDFHDITSGFNGRYSAGPGYDLVTGRGTPIVNQLVFDLAGVGSVPVGLAATAGERQVTLTWTGKIQTGTTFNIYRGTSPGGEGATPIATGLTTTSFTNTGLTDGVTYYYQVTSVTGGVESGRSSEVSATPILAPPANLGATPSAFTVTLGWTAYPGAASYNLYRGTSSGGEVVVATGITGTSFIDTGLSLGTKYYYQVTSVDAGAESARSSEITATTVLISNASIWNSSATPAVVDLADKPVELGVKFRSDVSGYITGLRFYSNIDSGTSQLGSLWDANGNLLATATFTESSPGSGWQQVNFATPVAIAANTTYVAGYFASTGHYSITNNYFATSGVDNGVLHAPSNAAAGGNGVYAYSSSSVFPTLSWSATNYWVDVVFSNVLTPLVVSQTLAPQASSVTATFNESVLANSISFVLRDSAKNPVAVTVSYNDSTHTASLQPTAALLAGTTYTATVSGATDAGGMSITAPVSWSFTTTRTILKASLWSPSATSTQLDSPWDANGN
jgi:hypothetical protein